MWTLAGVGDMRTGDNPSMPVGGLTMEDEMNLDGSVVAAAFDESLDMVSLFNVNFFACTCLYISYVRFVYHTQ
jgi:hypothetical protein